MSVSAMASTLFSAQGQKGIPIGVVGNVVNLDAFFLEVIEEVNLGGGASDRADLEVLAIVQGLDAAVFVGEY